MNIKNKENEEIKEVTQTEFAKINNVSKVYINKLIKQGKLKINKNKKLILNQAIEDYKNCKINEEIKDNNTNNSITYNEVMIKKIQIETQLKELELKKLNLELIELNDVISDINIIAIELKDSLFAIPSRIVEQISQEKDQKKIYNIITDEIRNTLDSISLKLLKYNNEK